MTSAPADTALLEVLEPALGTAVVRLERRPFEFATSFAIEELHVELAGGEHLLVLFKDLAWERLLGDAPISKPRFLYEPRRGILTYERIIGPAGIGARCVAAVADPAGGRQWLFLEKVAGMELWQIGDLQVWADVLRWLAAFHRRFAGQVHELRQRNPYLIDYGPSWYRSWAQRARDALEGSPDPRRQTLARALRDYDRVVERLVSVPSTFVHGEFYPSNVLVVDADGERRVVPVDWEMAGTGPGMLDVAAVAGGAWSPEEGDVLIGAYFDAAGITDVARARSVVDACRIHLAIQWVGWAEHWQPPAEHAHDWVGEALDLLEHTA